MGKVIACSTPSCPCYRLKHTRSHLRFNHELLLTIQPPPQGHPTRCPNQLDRQPRPQAPRGPRTHIRRKEEQGIGQGIKVQPHPCTSYLEEAQHVSPIPSGSPSRGEDVSLLSLSRAFLSYINFLIKFDGEAELDRDSGASSDRDQLLIIHSLSLRRYR